MSKYIYYKGELYHYGVLGMKWGRRKNVHPDHASVHDRKRISEMSNDELKKRNNRLEQESKYKNYKKQSNVGRKAVRTFIAGAATATAVVGAYKTYKKYGKAAFDAIGDAVMNGIKLSGKIFD